MANTPKDQAASTDLGRRLQALREQLPLPRQSINRIATALAMKTGVEINPETLRQLHSGKSDPSKVRPDYLIALARFYGVDSEALGPVAQERIGSLLQLTQNWKKMTPRQLARAS